MINITAMLKDGGYKKMQIDAEMMGQLAESISKQGYEYVALKSGVQTVVGFVVVGEQAGERMIILGSKGNANEQ